MRRLLFIFLVVLVVGVHSPSFGFTYTYEIWSSPNTYPSAVIPTGPYPYDVIVDAWWSIRGSRFWVVGCGFPIPVTLFDSLPMFFNDVPSPVFLPAGGSNPLISCPYPMIARITPYYGGNWLLGTDNWCSFWLTVDVNQAYKLSTSTSDLGTIDSNKTYYKENDTVFLTANPNPGVGLLSWVIDGVTIAASGTTQTFSMPAHDVAVSAEFSNFEVTSISATPDTLWVGADGAGSGLVFKATTTAPATVFFKVKSPSGQIYDVGSRDTSGSDFVAKLSWWGGLSGGALPASGAWNVTAEAKQSSKIASFTVIRTVARGPGMGSWMLTGKDPSAVLPPNPAPTQCPPTWDQIVGKPGYFSSIAVADPVSLPSGNLIFPEADLRLSSANPLILTRVYNSLDPHVGPFGRGWCCPYLARLEFLASDVVFVSSDGSRYIFTRDGDTFIGPDDVDLQLKLATDTGNWLLSQPQGSERSFDSEGRILRIAKACCGRGSLDAILIDYDGDGRMIRVTNPANQTLAFEYNIDGRIIRVEDSTGRVLSYSYDDAQNLLSFSDPLNRKTLYSYDEDGFLTRVERPGNRRQEISYLSRRVSSLTMADDAVSQFVWDTENHRVTLTDPANVAHEYGFSPSWRLISYSVPSAGVNKYFTSSGSALVGFENSMGANETYAYNSAGLCDTKTDALSETMSYEYQATSHLLTKRIDPLGREWAYNWCYRGNLLSEIDPAGNVTSYTYNAYNDRTSKTDPLGRNTRWVYDPSGNYLLQAINAEGGISSFNYNSRGNLVSSTDPLGRTTLFSFDLIDRLTKTTYPDGRFVEIEYDEAGNVALRRDNLGRETRYIFDLADRLATLTRPDGTTFSYSYNPTGQKISETDPLGRITRFTYSPIGLLTKITYADGAEETFTYDTESRLTSKTNELGQTSNLEYDQLGRLLATVDPTGARWESQYDAAGRKIADKDPLGRITTYQLDNLDRITKLIRPDNSFVTSSFDAVGNLLSTVDALGNQWTWVYDNLNRQVKAIQPNGASSTTTIDAAGQVITETDALNRTTRYSFDSGGRKTVTTDALGNVWQNFYDTAGRLISTQDPLGATVSMTYDLMDRVITQSDPLGNVNSFEFDAAGRRVAKTDAMGRRSITTFDLRDRVTSEVDPEGHVVSFGYNLAGQRVTLTDGANRVWRWALDGLGRVISETDPLGNVNHYSLDCVGNRTSWTNARGQITNYVFNEMNRLVQITSPDNSLASISYDLEGRELSRSGPAGTVVKTYDSVGNMTSETFGPWGKKWQYGFDLVGNRVSAVDPEGQVFNYRFDALNRLVQLDPPETGDEVKYTFDAAGRLITEERSGVKTVNAFDAAGRLLELKHERGSGTVVALCRYTYSPVGNRLTMTDENGGVTRYSYNSSDWLTKAIYPDGQQVSYSYNGAGDRLSETTETPTVKKVGRNSVIGTDTVVIPLAYDAGGRLISKASDTFDFDADGNQVAAVENGDETRYMWSADNRLTNVEKDLPCTKHGNKKCGQCQPVITAEEYSYLPQDWRRVTRSVFTHDGQRCKHGYGYGHGRGHVCDEIPGHGKGHDRDGQNDESVYVSVYDNQDESHEYLLKAGDHDAHNRRHKQYKCTADQQKPSLALVRSFIGGPSTDDLEYTRQDHRSLTMLKDALGSTIALTVSDGRPVARIGFDVWGNLKWPDKPGHSLKPCDDKDVPDWLDRFESGRSLGGGIDPWHFGRHHHKTLTPYLYTGRRFDQFAGQYFNRNRYYSPKVGRFTSRDPIGFDGGNNLWIYPLNPTLFLDPWGLNALTKYLVDKAVDILLKSGNPSYIQIGKGIDLNFTNYGGNPLWREIVKLNEALRDDACIQNAYQTTRGAFLQEDGFLDTAYYARLEIQLKGAGPGSIFRALRGNQKALADHVLKYQQEKYVTQIARTIIQARDNIATIEKFIKDKGLGHP